MRAFDRPTSLRRPAGLVLILAALAACGRDGGTGPSSLSGTYTLATVNGSPPPTTAAATLQGATYNARFDAGCCSVTLSADGSYQRSVRAQVSQSGFPFAVPVIADDRGRYAKADAGSLRFISTASNVTVAGQAYASAQVDTSIATVSGKRLTFGSGPAIGLVATLVFAKP